MITPVYYSREPCGIYFYTWNWEWHLAECVVCNDGPIGRTFTHRPLWKETPQTETSTTLFFFLFFLWKKHQLLLTFLDLELFNGASIPTNILMWYNCFLWVGFGHQWCWPLWTTGGETMEHWGPCTCCYLVRSSPLLLHSPASSPLLLPNLVVVSKSCLITIALLFKFYFPAADFSSFIFFRILLMWSVC